MALEYDPETCQTQDADTETMFCGLYIYEAKSISGLVAELCRFVYVCRPTKAVLLLPMPTSKHPKLAQNHVAHPFMPSAVLSYAIRIEVMYKNAAI